MATASPDTRSQKQKAADERIAGEPPLVPLDLPPGVVGRPLESFLKARKPMAVVGVVENGLIRPLDPAVSLPERSKVIIVTSTGG
jgi:hypothetical protein